jgi:hypothetical protein
MANGLKNKRKTMNLYRKIFFTFTCIFVSSLYSSEAEQLDASGRQVIIELTKVYDAFVQSLSTRYGLRFDSTEWNFLLKTKVKKYVEDNSKVLGIQDRTLTHYLNLLFSTNDSLLNAIKRAAVYRRPARTLNEVDFHQLIGTLLNPLEQIEQNIQNTIIPALEKEYYYVSADNKNKAKAMLILSFDLLRLIARRMINYTSAIIYKD